MIIQGEPPERSRSHGLVVAHVLAKGVDDVHEILSVAPFPWQLVVESDSGKADLVVGQDLCDFLGVVVMGLLSLVAPLLPIHRRLAFIDKLRRVDQQSSLGSSEVDVLVEIGARKQGIQAEIHNY